MSKRLFLIDGYSTIFRAFYAIRNLSNSKGEPTNATYGFVNMLRKLLRDESPDLVGIALDVSRKTFRSDSYAEYKANRSPMPDDLKAQIPAVRRAIEAFRIPILELEGFEADDVLGTVGRKAAAAGYEVVLVTADKDLMQLVGDGISLLHTGREKLYDAALVEEDFGVPPEQVVDVLALMGDAVDNVPGVPGIGEKGAKTLIREHGSLEKLLESAEQIKRKAYREGLLHHRDEALLSQKLARIDCDAAVDFEPAALRSEEPDLEALRRLYRELDFFKLLEELDEEEGAPQIEVEPATSVTDAETWTREIGALEGALTLSLVAGAGIVHGLAVGHGESAWWADFRVAGLRDHCREGLRRWLADEARTLVAHDLKEVLRLAGDAQQLEPRAQLVDTMLLAYLLPSAARTFGFDEVVYDRLLQRPMALEDAGFEKGQPPLADAPALLRMAAERVALTAQLRARLELAIEQSTAGDPQGVYQRIERPLLPVLVRMEESGIELDVGFLEQMSAELATELERLETEIYEIAGEQFNVNSSRKLGEIMFEKLGYPVLKRTRKTKSYSTSADTLEELAARGFDLPERLLTYREYSKLKSTYVDALPQLVDEGGRLHTSYEQAVAATGRLSSANPNLQNIPVRTEVGRRIRRAFRARQGALLLVADYSQIELRVLAHIAQEEALLQAFRSGIDIHRATAASVFGAAPELVSDEQRRAAKTINFGIIYGMSAFGLAQRLGIARGDAKTFIDAYFEQFPGVRIYTEATLQSVEELGYVETLYGRCRYLPDIKSRNRNLRENAKRMAVNARIQGTAADLQKLAMIAVDARLRESFPEARLLLTVHDELVLEVPSADCDEVTAMVVAEMEGVAELEVPLVVDVGVGETWYDAKA